MIIQSHSNHLLYIRNYGINGIKGLRNLLEMVEFHVRAIEGLGRSPESDSAILMPIWPLYNENNEKPTVIR